MPCLVVGCAPMTYPCSRVTLPKWAEWRRRVYAFPLPMAEKGGETARIFETRWNKCSNLCNFLIVACIHEIFVTACSHYESAHISLNNFWTSGSFSGPLTVSLPQCRKLQLQTLCVGPPVWTYSPPSFGSSLSLFFGLVVSNDSNGCQVE